MCTSCMFYNKVLHALCISFFMPCILHASPSFYHLVRLDLMMVLGKGYTKYDDRHCQFLSSALFTSFPLGPVIAFRTQFSNSFPLSLSLNSRDKIIQQYRTAGQSDFNILIFHFTSYRLGERTKVLNGGMLNLYPNICVCVCVCPP